MYDRLQAVEDRYDELNELLSDPDVVSDPKRLRDLSKEQSLPRQSKRTANTKM
ncbi:Peptide chain release factor 1 [Listeria monocytogenes]|nr:Peptide chain release factor 1 [Listeria monocytogenes]